MISDLIKQYRREAKMTQEELAEKCGLNRNSIYKYEKGLCLPKPKHLALISSALNIPSQEVGYALALSSTLSVPKAADFWATAEILQLISDSPVYNLVETISERLQKDFALEVQNDDLKDSGIECGDVVLFSFTDSPFANDGELEEGALFLVEINQQLHIGYIAGVIAETETIMFAHFINGKLHAEALRFSDLTIWGKATAILKQL